MSSINRRNFLRSSGSLAIPAVLPLSGLLVSEQQTEDDLPAKPVVKFFGDGEMYEPSDYIRVLQEADKTTTIAKDRYGVGGVVEALEKKFAALTGKEKAIFMPSGTMANQLAIAVLSGNKSKVFVQETSHVFRDEADAGQSVFQKRLVPLAKDETCFTAAQLQKTIDDMSNTEAFNTGFGAVSIENPVRRSDGRMVSLDEIRQIRKYCLEKKIPMHLDGARLYVASAWSGVSVKEYSRYFDTVYISLYKYLGASAGAILCGDAAVIDQMPHLIKIHGGSMYGNWTNAAMALHRMEGAEKRFTDAKTQAEKLFGALNKTGRFTVTALANGTNIYRLQLTKNIDGRNFQAKLNQQFNIRLGRPDANNQTLITINETLLYQSTEDIFKAFEQSAA
ncbi:aminotransferase class I/II-fold pyridoxal phosphate-dependent enzyme [Sediminibacterium sp.]|uniref:threonine aldolase family protein n=1 Tax=Sediminibacterium sp. TaxID=1917865 RepID=UPI0025E04F51|nr:aminotransferase class I/II-fold pyridoxal phosphate-dependent enzyme [Sediminibacterium sp.]MBW0176721.1 threonine aldolase family protein [Sediminibacterium sp.]